MNTSLLEAAESRASDTCLVLNTFPLSPLNTLLLLLLLLTRLAARGRGGSREGPFSVAGRGEAP